MFRLIIDFPCGEDLEEVKKHAQEALNLIKDNLKPWHEGRGIGDIKYRLQKDGDRSAHNYLNIDENGRALDKKLNLF